jgi:dihydroflavonol-4-reductase
MTTLITGGTGFLGRHLVEQLVAVGDRDLRVLTTRVPRWLSDLGVDVLQGSLLDPEVAAASVRGVSRIYHLAGRVSRDPNDAHLMYSLHVDGTRLLIDAAAAAGASRMVLASTSASNGNGSMAANMAASELTRVLDRR